MKKTKQYIQLGAIFILGIGVGSRIPYAFSSKKPLTAHSIQVMKEEKIQTEKKIEQRDKQYKIKAYYPYTAYGVLNQEIEQFIQKQINEFQKTIKDSPISPLQFYTLDISYQTMSYKNYLSYIFEIFLDTGGAHPNTYIHTISYDSNTNKIITIDTLYQNNPDILKILSTESRKKLMEDEKLKEVNKKDKEEMIMEGTVPTKNNFRNFAFSENGLMILFENYQVAPYVYGNFEVTIPYSILKVDT